MITVQVFDSGVICSECGEVQVATARSFRWDANRHVREQHLSDDYSVVTVSGPMPRKVELTRQQIIDALDGVNIGIHGRQARNGLIYLSRWGLSAVADALVAASEADR